MPNEEGMPFSIVYSRTIDNAARFAADYNLLHFTDNMEEAINHTEVDVVIISLPNHLHEAAVAACVTAKKAVLCTKPLGRTAEEAKRMLHLVEGAGIFAGYLKTCVIRQRF
jgi:predicted dehydrogenase